MAEPSPVCPNAGTVVSTGGRGVLGANVRVSFEGYASLEPGRSRSIRIYKVQCIGTHVDVDMVGDCLTGRRTAIAGTVEADILPLPCMMVEEVFRSREGLRGTEPVLIERPPRPITGPTRLVGRLIGIGGTMATEEDDTGEVISIFCATVATGVSELSRS